MSPFVHVTAASTVNEVLANYPGTAPILHVFGLDTCCRASSTLRDAAAHVHADLGVLLTLLETSACASQVGVAD